jgi:hypothetical protein
MNDLRKHTFVSGAILCSCKSNTRLNPSNRNDKINVLESRKIEKVPK